MLCDILLRIILLLLLPEITEAYPLLNITFVRRKLSDLTSEFQQSKRTETVEYQPE